MISLSSLNAQQPGNDIVFLKDGSSHTGIIIEQKPGQYLRLLELPEQDTVQLDYRDIDRIAKEVLRPAEEAANNTDVEEAPLPFFNKNRWMQLHYYGGGGDYSLGGFGLTVSQALDREWWLGVGVHYISQLNTRPFENQQFLAVSGDVKWNYSSSANGRWGNYLVLNAGYYFPFNRTFMLLPNEEEVITRSTFYLNPSVGVRYSISRSVGVMIDIGYQMTTANYISRTTNERLDRRVFQNISLRGTLIF